MTDGTFALIELLLVFGLVIGWALWQLWSVRRAPHRDEADRAGRTSAPDAADDDPAAERRTERED